MFERFKKYFRIFDHTDSKKKMSEKFKRLGGYSRSLKNIFYVLLISYVAAITVNLAVLNVLTKGVNFKRATIGRKNLSSARVDLASNLNYNKVIDSILERNIFNAEGIYPKEAPVNTGQEVASVFDESATCGKLSLPLTVQGVVLMNTDKSLVIIREPTYSEADVYTVGDSIIGNDETFIASVDDEKVVFNNEGRKECVYLFKPLSFATGEVVDNGFDDNLLEEEGSAGQPSTVVLRSDFVEKELGPGFARAISSARFVPNIDPADGSTRGFKIFSIRGGSLFSKAGLSNGDIIKSVNDVSLLKAEQGFALYEAFQNEREIRIELERKSQPVSKTIRVVQ